ncbi:UNVERIFIED_CONTAM: hypothetical protein HDU68_005234 [Siphonaria sp. JEL0065]|nr:hypothetical protein HDU68_005234 [Siphonaria sp. JEL0065]
MARGGGTRHFIMTAGSIPSNENSGGIHSQVTRQQPDGRQRCGAVAMGKPVQKCSPKFSQTAGAQAKKLERLAVFDFDSTLFRSPLPSPSLWAPELRGSVNSDCGWFVEPRTLSPPYVPPTPGADWWDAAVVDQVRRQRESGALVVLLTGRRHDLFAARVADLCASANLLFDLRFLKEPANPDASVVYDTTLDYKWAVITKLLDAFKDIRHVEIWDDRIKHLDIVAKKAAPLKLSGRLDSFESHHIIQDPVLAKFIPEDLEYTLVMELIGKCNARILAATERETTLSENSANSASQQQLPNSSTESLPPVIELKSPCTSPTDADFPSELKEASASSSNPQLASASQATVLPPAKPLTPKEKRKAAAASRASTPRKSISCFRSVIDVVELVQYTGVFLSPESTRLLLDSIEMPNDTTYAIKAHHVTICMGKAPDDLLQPLGGLGAPVCMKAVAFGSVKGVVAVKIELDWKRTLDVKKQTVTEGKENEAVSTTTEPRLTTNETPHCTMYVSGSAKAKDSNLITEWVVLDHPLLVDGVIGEKKLYGIKTAPQREQKPKDVSLGALIKKYHPQVKGREIGDAVKRIEEWMDKTHMDNAAHCQPEIELYISNMKISD